MPLYEYKALNKSGRNVKGSVDADNVRNARIKLKKKGIYVVEIQDRTKKKSRGKVKTSGGSVGVDDLSLTTRQLATLLKAGIPLVDAIGIASEQTENQTLKEALADVKNQVNEGGSLHKALIKYPKIFDKIFISMCEAGEMSGTLDMILLRLAEFTESQSELRAKLRSAMIYPIIMFIVMAIVMTLLFVYMIPQMKEIFDGEDDLTLPFISEIVFGISDFMVEYWMFVGGSVAGAIFLFIAWKNTPAGAETWDGMTLKFPLFGKLTRMVAVSRFTRTLATLLDGGVPMLNAMTIVRNVVSNEVLAKSIDEARDNISEGESIAGPLKRSGQFPPIVIHMINVGEKTGELEQMLNQVSDSYDFQVKTKVDGFTSILEPIMLVVMGVMIAVIVFAVLLPMLEMQNVS